MLELNEKYVTFAKTQFIAFMVTPFKLP